eukprot:3268322-Rhodomonas_salina.2
MANGSRNAWPVGCATTCVSHEPALQRQVATKVCSVLLMSSREGCLTLKLAIPMKVSTVCSTPTHSRRVLTNERVEDAGANDLRMLHPSKGAADGIAGLASVHDPLVGLDELGREKVDHVPLVAALLVHDAAHRLREAQHRPVQADKLRNAARSDLRWDRRVHVRVGDIVVASAREVRDRERFVCRHCIIVVHRNLVVEVDAGR